MVKSSFLETDLRFVEDHLQQQIHDTSKEILENVLKTYPDFIVTSKSL